MVSYNKIPCWMQHELALARKPMGLELAEAPLCEKLHLEPDRTSCTNPTGTNDEWATICWAWRQKLNSIMWGWSNCSHKDNNGFGKITPHQGCSALLPSDIPDAPWIPDSASHPNSSSLPYFALPISRLHSAPTQSLCTDYASSCCDFWCQIAHTLDI